MSTFTPPTVAVAGALAKSADVNNLSLATAAAFALLPTETELTRGTVNYAVDTGTANTYLVDLPHTPSGYADGLLVVMRPITDCTGASSINVNSLGVKSIKTASSTAPAAGDINAGVPISLRYSSATGFFHIVSNSAASALAAAASAVAAALSAVAAAASASAASGSASAASTAQTNAETAETNAETAETNAETAETGALAAQLAAETAKTAAETAETHAEAAETNAETAETNAVAAQGAAETAQTAAELAETHAETAETNAETAETNAVAAQGAAVIAQTAAELAETHAETAETNAETAETNAAGSALAASGSASAASLAQTAAELAETHAETAETNAETAETNAETAETNAAASALAASGSASAASIAQTAAELAETHAETAETNAETAETNAETAETNAAASALAAAASAAIAADFLNSVFTAADQVIVGTGVNTHGQVTLAASQLFGKASAGAAKNLTATEVRTIINVDSGADVTGSNAPQAHSASHENAGGDEISVAGLSGTLADAQTAAAHKTSHQNGGGDEISVAALSGLLADDQHVLDAEVQAVSINNLVEDTTPQLGGDMDLNAKDITLPGIGDLTSDSTWAAIASVSLTAGTNLVIGNLAYLASSDSKMEKTDADAVGTTRPLLGLATATINENADGVFLLIGVMRLDSWTWASPGEPIYVDNTTAGAMTQTAPTTSTEQVRIVGYALSDDEIFFCPSGTYVEVP